MNLADIIQRKSPPAPWEDGEKIPWNDPAFSRRMLQLHLSQDHDWASRRLHLVEQHVDWIDREILRPNSRVLDLGCGPGLYTHRLSRRGHECVGLDFSPASIAYAKSQAAEEGLSIDYRLADVRHADFGRDFNLVMMIFGEFNVFRPAEAEDIVRKSWSALSGGGSLLIECHTFAEVQRQGTAPPSWQSAETGLFADSPHLWLEEHFWHEECTAATTRYFIVDAASGTTTRYASTMQAYTDEQYKDLLTSAGFLDVQALPGMGEADHGFKGKLQVMMGTCTTGCRSENCWSS